MSLKSFVNDKTTWEAFLVEIEERISTQHRSMERLQTLLSYTDIRVPYVLFGNCNT